MKGSRRCDERRKAGARREEGAMGRGMQAASRS